MKKKLLGFLLGTTLVFGLTACGGSDDKSSEPKDAGKGDVASAGAGEDVYKKSCMSCHGGDLEGGVGPKLDKIGATSSKDDILAVIKEGPGSMPADVVTGADAEAVAEWLAEKK